MTRDPNDSAPSLPVVGVRSRLSSRGRRPHAHIHTFESGGERGEESTHCTFAHTYAYILSAARSHLHAFIHIYIHGRPGASLDTSASLCETACLVSEQRWQASHTFIHTHTSMEFNMQSRRERERIKSKVKNSNPSSAAKRTVRAAGVTAEAAAAAVRGQGRIRIHLHAYIHVYVNAYTFTLMGASPHLARRWESESMSERVRARECMYAYMYIIYVRMYAYFFSYIHSSLSCLCGPRALAYALARCCCYLAVAFNGSSRHRCVSFFFLQSISSAGSHHSVGVFACTSLFFFPSPSSHSWRRLSLQSESDSSGDRCVKCSNANKPTTKNSSSKSKKSQPPPLLARWAGENEPASAEQVFYCVNFIAQGDESVWTIRLWRTRRINSGSGPKNKERKEQTLYFSWSSGSFAKELRMVSIHGRKKTAIAVVYRCCDSLSLSLSLSLSHTHTHTHTSKS